MKRRTILVAVESTDDDADDIAWEVGAMLDALVRTEEQDSGVQRVVTTHAWGSSTEFRFDGRRPRSRNL